MADELSPDFDDEFDGEFGPDPLALRGLPGEHVIDPGAALTPSTAESPRSGDRGIRSFISFATGLVLVAIGISILVSELAPLRFAQPASIAVLTAGAILFGALLGAPRRGRSNS